ncbi:unnamed protein product [Cochlearia groenlandica]
MVTSTLMREMFITNNQVIPDVATQGLSSRASFTNLPSQASSHIPSSLFRHPKRCESSATKRMLFFCYAFNDAIHCRSFEGGVKDVVSPYRTMPV